MTLQDSLNDLSKGKIFVNAIQKARAKTYLLGNHNGSYITDFTPAFVVSYTNSKGITDFYMISHDIIKNASMIYHEGKFQTTASFIAYKGSYNKLSVYRVLNSKFASFEWASQLPTHGQKIFATGAHIMADQSILRTGYILINKNYSITQGVVDGTISAPYRLINNASYIQHTAELDQLNNEFGPLFSVENNEPVLLGINMQFGYIDRTESSYIGVSFAYSRSYINDILRKIIGV